MKIEVIIEKKISRAYRFEHNEIRNIYQSLTKIKLQIIAKKLICSQFHPISNHFQYFRGTDQRQGQF